MGAVEIADPEMNDARGDILMGIARPGDIAERVMVIVSLLSYTSGTVWGGVFSPQTASPLASNLWIRPSWGVSQTTSPLL
jgi:hypothetical protein